MPDVRSATISAGALDVQYLERTLENEPSKS
jgi:hypothetical protein